MNPGYDFFILKNLLTKNVLKIKILEIKFDIEWQKYLNV